MLMDRYTRRIVGWYFRDDMSERLTVTAIQRSHERRKLPRCPKKRHHLNEHEHEHEHEHEYRFAEYEKARFCTLKIA